MFPAIVSLNRNKTFKIMVKGTAAKSSSGASMSKYDVEVEARLIALEAAVAELKEHSHPDCSTTTGTDDRVDKIIAHMAKKEDIGDIF